MCELDGVTIPLSFESHRGRAALSIGSRVAVVDTKVKLPIMFFLLFWLYLFKLMLIGIELRRCDASFLFVGDSEDVWLKLMSMYSSEAGFSDRSILLLLLLLVVFELLLPTIVPLLEFFPQNISM